MLSIQRFEGGRQYQLWGEALKQRKKRRTGLGWLVATGRVTGIVINPIVGSSDSESESSVWSEGAQQAWENTRD